MKDWRGTDIKQGSIIVYPGRQSSHMWMVEAEVIEIIQTEHWGVMQTGLLVQPIRQGRYGRANMKPVKLTALEKITVIEECKKPKTLAQVMEEAAA